MKLKFDMELVKTIGKGAGKYGKLVVVEGVKSVLGQGAVRIINTSMDEGLSGVKKMKFDDIVGVTKKSDKKKLFGKSKKEETEELIDEVVPEAVEAEVEIEDKDIEEIKIDDADVTIVEGDK